MPTLEVLHESGGNHTKEERLGAVAQACNASTWEVNAGGSGVQAQPHLHSQLKAHLDYMKSHLKRNLSTNQPTSQSIKQKALGLNASVDQKPKQIFVHLLYLVSVRVD